MPPITSKEPRKTAPQAMISQPHVDDRTLLVEKTKKALGKKAEGMHFFYGDKAIAETGRYKDEGYIPCDVAHRGDPLFMRPIGVHKNHLAEAANISNTKVVTAPVVDTQE